MFENLCWPYAVHTIGYIDTWCYGKLRKHILFFKIDFLKSSFQFRATWRGRYGDLPKTTCPPTYAWPPSLPTSPSRAVHLLQLMNQIDKPLSPQVHEGYIRIHSCCCTFSGFGHIYNDICHHYIIQSSFTVLCDHHHVLPSNLLL